MFGFATLVAATCVVEWMLRIGILNRYIVPLPSEVMLSFPRIVIEEKILERFLTTFMECLYAMLLVSVIGILTGILLYRFTALRAATFPSSKPKATCSVAAASRTMAYWPMPPSSCDWIRIGSRSLASSRYLASGISPERIR